MQTKLPNNVSEKRFKRLVNELVDDHCSCNYCFLKTFIECLRPEPFVLVQLKCIEMFKWEQSKLEGSDIGWNEAGMRWANNGYASAFRYVFDEDLSIREVYNLTIDRMDSIKDNY